MSKKDHRITRRELLKSATLAGAGLGLARPVLARGSSGSSEKAVADGADAFLEGPSTNTRSVIGMKFQPHDTVRVGIIGVGGRGSEMLGEFLAVENVEITALCDIVKEKVE